MSFSPNLVAEDGEKRLPAAIGVLIATGMSAGLWGAIYAACMLRF